MPKDEEDVEKNQQQKVAKYDLFEIEDISNFLDANTIDGAMNTAALKILNGEELESGEVVFTENGSSFV